MGHLELRRQPQCLELGLCLRCLPFCFCATLGQQRRDNGHVEHLDTTPVLDPLELFVAHSLELEALIGSFGLLSTYDASVDTV